MNFVYPQFLFALFAVSVPILIHLFNFRRFKKIYFSDIRFLKEVKLQTQSRNRLKHLLVLLFRILAVSFLVFAFAQPYLPLNNANTAAGIKSVSVFVDNSFSMENVSRDGVLLEEGKKFAREIAFVHSQTDRFQLLTNDFEARHQHFVSRDDFLALLDEISISPSVKSLSEITTMQNELLVQSDAKNKTAYIISDFQKTISDFENIKNDTLKTILIPVTSSVQNNLYIDSCWFDTPVMQLNQPIELNVRMKNLSENFLENISIKLFINGQQKTPSSFSIGPDETKTVVLSFTLKEAGIQHGKIEIPDYPVTYDDSFYFSFSAAKQIRILCISGADENKEIKPFQSLFGKDSLYSFIFSEDKKLDYSSFSKMNLILLNNLPTVSSGLAQELQRFVSQGGSLAVFPSAETDTSSYRTFLLFFSANYFLSKDTSDTKVDRVNYQSEIFSDVFDKEQENLDLPFVRAHYTLSRLSRSYEEVILKMQNGNPFVARYAFGKGKVYLCAAPLSEEFTNLAKHAIFVPLMYNIALNSQPQGKLFYVLGEDQPIETNARMSGENVFKIKGENNFEIIPENRVTDGQSLFFVHGQIQQAGNYLLLSGIESVEGISFNYDRKESVLSCYAAEDLVSLYEKNGLHNFSLMDAGNQEIAKAFSDLGYGKKFWKWCVLLVLLFLAAETALLRLWK